MNARAPMVQLFALALILASVVNLAFIYYATSRPRAVAAHVAREEPAPAPAPKAVAVPRPRVPMEAALRYGDVNEVKQHVYWCMKEHSCDLEKDLRLAVAADSPKAAEVLVAAGANVNKPGRDAETPLHTAAEQGGTGVASVLIRSGANVDARDVRGMTPLHDAASWGHVGLTRLLLESGADVNATDGNRQTPLHMVAARRIPPLAVYADVARMLLEAGARANVRAADGSTPLQLAKQSASRLKLDGNMKAAADANEVVALLRGHGALE